MKFFCRDMAFIRKLIIVILVVIIIILLITGRCSNSMRFKMFWF